MRWTVVGPIVVLLTIGAVVVSIRTVDGAAFSRAVGELIDDPGLSSVAVGAFASAFLVRAVIWRRMVPGLSLGQSWAAIHVALAGNHLLPFRLGEPLRVASAVRRTEVSLADATASTVTLRAADVLGVLGLAWVLGAGGTGFLRGPLALVAVATIGVVGFLGLAWIWRRTSVGVRRPGAIEVVGTLAAWIAESGLVLVVGRAAGLDLSPLDAVFVTSVSVAAQVVAVTPGGFGTYEAAAVAAYAFLGHDPGTALAAALAAHALKTAYAVVAGGVAVVVPAPSLIGRLRLSRSVPERVPAPPPTAGPIVLFMPAHDEAAVVGDVVDRVPAEVGGHEVVTIVVDDGSSDATATVARDAGADVVSSAQNRGLGAAVRTGFVHALARRPAAVAFCDADGEYAPEELGRLVAPVLDGRADYVVGSRFAGSIERMLPHRRFGNRLLTRVLAFVARRPISDGQSGYRAFSPEAAADAEIVHDFNYAQVLTLDLLAKGFRYEEVPISYHFRTTGTSFVRLGRYLRAVIPGVYRELNRPAVVRGGVVISGR